MTWMTSIVRNRALDYLRSQKNSDIAVDDADEMVLSIADDSPGALAVLLSVAEAKLLRNCLKLLDAHQQESIAAAFYRGLSHDQVASELGIALGTVKSWIRRGLERLRQCMDGNTG
jgi:RNA polymerase sigma-70 factor (ECF subfamily)